MTDLDELRLQLEELRASRARVVAAADAERRALERALHDGVQQHLVALAVNVQLARQLAKSDPGAATALLDDLARDIREALESVRQIAWQIYPPLLIDRGLAEALAGAASTVGIPTRVETEGLARYPDDIEAAVYFCCVEALHVAGSLGAGTNASVRVHEMHDELRFEVTARLGAERGGPGPGEPAAPIADRIDAVDGHVTTSWKPDKGLSVCGVVPLPR